MSLPSEALSCSGRQPWGGYTSSGSLRQGSCETRLKRRLVLVELPAVTQLFTEDYMVEFLLHNTLGAWWAGRRCSGGVEAGSEEDARARIGMPGVEWTFLRFVQNDERRWVPAAGTFDEWPPAARHIRILDPSMGSGHFLVSALPMLVGMRQLEEQTDSSDACSSVLHDNRLV